MAGRSGRNELQEAIASILSEFLEILTHSILYTREVYLKEAFECQNHYHVPVYICTHPAVQDYLRNINHAVLRLTAARQLQHYTVLILDEDDNVLERFTFELNYPRNFHQPDDSKTMENLEVYMRETVMNTLNVYTKLAPLHPQIDLSFTVNLHTSEGSLTSAVKGLEQGSPDFFWKEVSTDRVGKCNSRSSLNIVNSALFRMQALAEEYPAKRTAATKISTLKKQ